MTTASDPTVIAEELRGLTASEMVAYVHARMRADRLPRDAAPLEALDAEPDDAFAVGRMIDRFPGMRRAQFERVANQSAKEGERQAAFGAWMMRWGDALEAHQKRAGKVPLDGATADRLTRELVALVASWPTGPRLRVAS